MDRKRERVRKQIRETVFSVQGKLPEVLFGATRSNEFTQLQHPCSDSFTQLHTGSLDRVSAASQKDAPCAEAAVALKAWQDHNPMGVNQMGVRDRE